MSLITDLMTVIERVFRNARSVGSYFQACLTGQKSDYSPPVLKRAEFFKKLRLIEVFLS